MPWASLQELPSSWRQAKLRGDVRERRKEKKAEQRSRLRLKWSN